MEKPETENNENKIIKRGRGRPRKIKPDVVEVKVLKKRGKKPIFTPEEQRRKYLEYQKIYYRAHKEKMLEQSNAYYRNNRQHVLDHCKDIRENYPERYEKIKRISLECQKRRKEREKEQSIKEELKKEPEKQEDEKVEIKVLPKEENQDVSKVEDNPVFKIHKRNNKLTVQSIKTGKEILVKFDMSGVIKLLE